MKDFPYPENPGKTHFEGCYRLPRHHNCAVAMVDKREQELAEVRAELAAAREAIRTVLVAEANNDGWGPDVTHLATLKNALVTPSSADKVQVVLEAAEEYINRLPHEIGPQMLMQSGVDKLYEAVRALREKG
jgi:hypothetical protein